MTLKLKLRKAKELGLKFFVVKSTFIIFILSISLQVRSQTQQYKHQLFSFKIHNDFKQETVEGNKVYKTSTMYLNIKEITTYNNAQKYAEALEVGIAAGILVAKRIDTLGGWPVKCIQTKKVSAAGTYIQEYFLFDNGKSVFNLSIAYWLKEELAMQKLFAVTRSSFKFKTSRKSVASIFIDVPDFLGLDADSKIIWSRVYDGDEKVDVPIRFNFDPNINLTDAVKSQVKLFKELKCKLPSNKVMTVKGLTIHKMSGSYFRRLSGGLKPATSRTVYMIELPKGGVTYMFFVASPETSVKMEIAMDLLLNSISVTN